MSNSYLLNQARSQKSELESKISLYMQKYKKIASDRAININFDQLHNDSRSLQYIKETCGDWARKMNWLINSLDHTEDISDRREASKLSRAFLQQKEMCEKIKKLCILIASSFEQTESFLNQKAKTISTSDSMNKIKYLKSVDTAKGLGTAGATFAFATASLPVQMPLTNSVSRGIALVISLTI